MSCGQKPRWPDYFPRMKQRGTGRGRGFFLIQYDTDGPIWPPVPGDPRLTSLSRRYPHPRSGRKVAE